MQARVSTDFVQQILPLQPFRAFAFPFNDVEVSLRFFESLNFDVSFGCAGVKGDTAPRHWQRVAMERGTVAAPQIVASAYLYHLLLKLTKKSVILRS